VIVIDTSALIAILNNEPERLAFMTAIAADDRRLLSRGRYGEPGRDDLESLIGAIEPEVVPFDEARARRAFAAFAAYGKGINPATKLNLCDCIAYALCKSFDAPLLFKGDDFRATDVVSVL